MHFLRVKATKSEYDPAPNGAKEVIINVDSICCMDLSPTKKGWYTVYLGSREGSSWLMVSKEEHDRIMRAINDFIIEIE